MATHLEGVDGNAAKGSSVTGLFPQVLRPPPKYEFVPSGLFLVGYLKDKIFETVVPNENVLRQRITEEIQ